MMWADFFSNPIVYILSNLDFLLLLLLLTIFCWSLLITHYVLRGASAFPQPAPKLLQQAKSLWPVFFVVLLLRSFVGQPFTVPSGSLEPTVLPGDFILVSQYSYGLRLPVWHQLIWPVSHPKRGDIALFHWPVDTRVTFVKRVIGLPGDDVSYVNKVFIINGQPIAQQPLGTKLIRINHLPVIMSKREENLFGLKHQIYVCQRVDAFCPNQEQHDFYHVRIPAGQYLMIGDNRDGSDDSRSWGFVPEDQFIGQARLIWLSWDSQADWLHKIRWHRMGTRL